MYVFHMPLHVFFGVAILHRLVGPHPTHAEAFAYITASVVVSFVAAALSYHLFERHFLRLKEKLLPVRRLSTAVLPGGLSPLELTRSGAPEQPQMPFE
jgi:peptidoglycan/LPS O-acetylase OafA/YrhL